MRVWVDTGTGEWGEDIDAVYAVDIPQDRIDEFRSLTPEQRSILATGFGFQLRMLGCQHNKKEVDQ